MSRSCTLRLAPRWAINFVVLAALLHPPAAGAADCKFFFRTVREGQSVTAYKSRFAGEKEACVSEQRTCRGGTLTGSFSEPTCRVGSLPVLTSTWAA